MELTVCVCTHNRPAYVRDCLDGLRRQTVGPDSFEVLIVDSGSTGTTPAILADYAAAEPNARLIRLERPGVSLARNEGARAALTRYIAYIDDDAIPAPDWIASILHALHETERPPSVLGGRILPLWEVPLPAWWPAPLRGVLSIIEHEGSGEYRSDALPRKLEPYGANIIVDVPMMLQAGGFGGELGRLGDMLLSDEEVQLAWRLQDAGQSARYDSRIVVYHQIQAERLRPEWLLRRLYWQGASTVLTRRMLGYSAAIWRELPRRIVVASLFLLSISVPHESVRLLSVRWRVAYASGFIRAAFGWDLRRAALRIGGR